MEVEQTSAEGLKQQLKVRIPAEDIEQRVESKLSELSKQAQLPGFRPGKVPISYLRQRYGQSVRGEVIQEAVNESSQSALDERNIQPAQQPSVELTSADEGGDVEFTVTVEELPSIEPADVRSLALEKVSVPVREEEIQEQLDRLARRNRETESLGETRPAEQGDIVAVTFQGYVDGQAREDMAASDETELELGSGDFIPGFEEQLVGASPGETLEVTATMPEEERFGELAGKTATFSVTVHDLRRAKDQEIDDSLAERLGLESLDELKDLIRKQIAEQYDNAAHMINKRRVLDKLAELHTFDVPPGMVDQEYQAIWQQFQQQKEQGQLSEEEANKPEDQVQAEYQRIAERRVRLGLLLAEIARQENIEVSQDELNQAIVREAQQHRGREREVFDYFRQNPNALEQLRAPLLEDKVIRHILEVGEVTERELTPDELRAEQEKLDSFDEAA